eukprot:gene9151-1239_t
MSKEQTSSEYEFHKEAQPLISDSTVKGIQIEDTTYYKENEEGQAGILSTVINIANAAVGAGVLALPYAFRCAGLIGGIVILTLTLLMTIYSLRMIVHSVEKTKKYNYDEVLQAAFGKFFGIFMRLLLVLITTGNQIVYLIILGDSFPPFLSALNTHFLQGRLHWLFLNRYFITGVVAFGIILPLTCLQNLDSLKYPSAIAVFSVFYLVALIVVYRIFFPYTEIIEDPNNPIVLFNFSFDIFLAFPIIIFSQNCHILTFPIMKELKAPTVSRMEWSTRIGVSVYAIVYMLVGVMGYLSFYGLTNENVLKNLVSDQFSIPITLAQIGISFTALFSYPLQTFACRNALNLLFFAEKEFSYTRHCAWAAALVVFSFVSKKKLENLMILVSSVVPKIGVVFGFIGASSGIFVMYVIPGLIFMKLVVFEEKIFSVRKVIQSILPMLMIIVGTILAIICTVTVAYSEIKTWF